MCRHEINFIREPTYSRSITMSKIVQFAEFGGPEVLRFNDIDLGKPKAGEVKLVVSHFETK